MGCSFLQCYFSLYGYLIQLHCACFINKSTSFSANVKAYLTKFATNET
jgi:hypothetical protein